MLPLFASAKPLKFDIPAQSAANALLVFSKQCGIDVLYSFADLQAVRSQNVVGEFEPDAALVQLLRDTGYSATRDPAGKFVVTAMQPRTANVRRIGSNPAREPTSISGRVWNNETGRNLKNARVSIRGTAFSVLTDGSGTYHLAGVPAGLVVLTALYIGLEAEEAELVVTAGRTHQHDFALGKSAPPLRLEKMTVREARLLQTEAINEQRFAPNLKLVAATANGQFTDQGNIGEFMKELPGVTAEYYEDEVAALAIRGFSSNLVGLTLDGVPFDGANEMTRGFSTRNLSLNNIARIEVTLVPTPATPADFLGGSINLVTKSAFERTTPELTYRVFASANQHAMTLRRSVDSSDRRGYRILPGFTFDYTLPLGENFGLVLSASRSQSFEESSRPEREFAVSGGGASLSNPYLRYAYFRYNAATLTRNSGGLKADWRATPNLVLSFGAQGVAYDNHFYRLIWYADAGDNALAFGPGFTGGAPGRGSLGMTGGYWKYANATLAEQLRGRFDDGTWRVEAGAHYSNSKGRYLGPGEGYFNRVDLSSNPVRVNFSDITSITPAVIQVFDRTNQPVDPARIQNYHLDFVAAFPGRFVARTQGVDASIRRRFDGASFPAALQIGGSEYTRTHDDRTQNDVYTHGAAAASDLTPYLSGIANQPLAASFSPVGNNLPWVSTRKLYAAWQDDPTLFFQTPSQTVTSESSRITKSNWIQENVTAGYLQGETQLFHNRLSLVTGVRWEQTKDVGLAALIDPGAVYMRDASGSFVHDAQGVRIRRPDAGAPGSLDELRLTTRDRAVRAIHVYDGLFPSVNATQHVTENFQLRFGWAKTYGRPDFSAITARTTINQANLSEQQFLDPTRMRGTMTANNPALKPWSADNYDLSFECYTDDGGLVTLGVFQKNIVNFFGNIVRPATAADLQTLGLDPSYLGWNLSTQTNTGTARIRGGTLNLKRSLRRLAPLGQYFSVFGNVTALQLTGDRQADFTSFIRRSATWGLACTARNFEVTARWNYRGLQRNEAYSGYGPDAYDYTAPTTFLDVNLEWRLREKLSLFAGARNLLNRPRVKLSYGPETPAYAREWSTIEYGAQFTAGIKGTF